MLSVGATQFWMNSPPAVEPLRLRRIPLFLLACSFACGEVLARNYQPTRLLVLATLALLGLIVYALRLSTQLAFVPAAALWVVVGCWCAQVQPPIPQQTALRGYADGLSRIIQGRITHIRTVMPEQAEGDTQQLAPWQIEPGGWETDAGSPRESVDLEVTSVEYLTPDISQMVPIQGGVRVLIIGESLALRCGDMLEMPLRLRVPDTYRNGTGDSYAALLLSNGIGTTASVKSAKVISHAAEYSTLRCRIYAVQSWAASRLQAFQSSLQNRQLPAFFRLDAEDTAMLNAMLFGNRDLLSHPMRDAFQNTGTFHLVVVSGLHVALVVGGIFWLLRRLRTPEGLAVLTSILLSAAYTVVVGFGMPAQRAWLMASLYLLARWLDREVTALNALGFAALVVLGIDPRGLFEASFQMTFLVIVAIAGLAAPLMQRATSPYARAIESLSTRQLDTYFPPRLGQLRVRLRMACDLTGKLLTPRLQHMPASILHCALYAVDALIISLAAELCLVIPMAVYFHRATLYALPLNLVNLPLLALVLCSSIVMFCASLLSPGLALLPAAITATLLHLMRFSVLVIRHASLADLRLPEPPSAVLVGCILLLAVALWLLRSGKQFAFSFGVLCTLLIPVAVLMPLPPKLHANALEVTALDVGQGDSLLVVSPEGQTMLVDAGGPVGRGSTASASGWDVGEQVVAPYLWSRRIRRLDVVVLTHAHSDHMGGMPSVLRDFRPRELWLSVEPGDSPGLAALLADAHSLNITVRHLRAGDSVLWGGVNASVLSPEPTYTNDAAAVNDDSLVMRLDYGAASALFEGDAEVRSEDTMLTAHRLAPVTLLKIGHHGSKTSTNPEFLAAVAPREAIISVGRHNTFGHPRSEVLERLEAANVRTFRTDRVGAETFLLTQKGEVSAFSAESQE